MRELLRGFLIAGGGSSLGIVLWLGVVKIIAIVAGPAGVGTFSLLRQLQQVASTGAQLNGQPAIIQGIASREGEAQGVYWREVRWILTLSLCVVALILLLAAPWISTGLSGALSAALIRGVVPAVAALVLLNVATALLNARRALGWIAVTQGASGLAALALAVPAARALRDGTPVPVAVLVCLTGAAVAGLIAAVVGIRATGGPPVVPTVHDRAAALEARGEFLRLTGTLLISGGLVAATPLLVRAMLARRHGLESVGHFDAAWTVGVTLVMLILTAIYAYYLPTLSQTKDDAERRVLVDRFFRVGCIALLPALAVAQVAKGLIVRVLYSGEFMPALPLLQWLLVGGYALAAGWMLGLPLLVYGRKRLYLRLQVAWCVLFLAGALAVTPSPAWADRLGVVFVASHVLLFVATAVVVSRSFGLDLRRALLRWWLPGAAFLVLLAWLTWGPAPGSVSGDI